MPGRRLLSLWLVVALGWPGARRAEACAPAPPPGAMVEIAEEEAAIVWDAERHVEHFIRRAAFRSTARAFGFLVPTPTVPELGEVPDTTFYELAHALQPELREQPGGVRFSLDSWSLGPFMMLKASARDEVAARPAVRVIASAHVAGFDASTLEADDPASLTAWLGAHGFGTTPELTAWLAGYVAARWKITAFVVATDEQDAARYDVATRAVRMSFHTDVPFYPYREPVPAAPAAPAVTDRLLRVFFVADQRYAATMAGAPWSARVVLAAPVQLSYGTALPDLAGKRPFVTAFHDDASPRRCPDEVVFAPSADRAEVHPPPIVVVRPREISIPIEGLLLLVIGAGWWWWRRRRAVARVITA